MKKSTNPIINFFRWVRQRLFRKRKNMEELYYIPVYLEHKEISGQIVKQIVSIKAYNRAHARFRLETELRLRIGTASKRP